MKADVLVARFRLFYGHTNFQDEEFTDDEYTYKLKRGQQMREEWLSREALDALVNQANWAEACQRVAQSFSMPSGALARWNEYQWVRDLDEDEQRRFTISLRHFLYGEGPFLERLEQFETEATGIYRQFLDRDPAQQKKYGSRSLSWPFISYFHFMMWPDQEYVFVKPTPLRKAARAADFDIQYEHKRPVTYGRVQEFYRTLWPTVKRMGGRDWIDVQTLIHVAGEGFGVPEGGWIDKRDSETPVSVQAGVRKIISLLRRKPQVVLQGAPGTGKTHTALLATAGLLGLGRSDDMATLEALSPYQLTALLDEDPSLADDPIQLAEVVQGQGMGMWEIVQLHPSYTYEDFVRGLQAEPSGDQIAFRATNRVLAILAETASALNERHLPVVLILDEINRGDLSKVLGELIYALEYREKSVLTPYAVGGRYELELPPNLYIIGTMNTADRSIALVDYAIRRRFYFVTLRPNRDVILAYYRDRPILGQQAAVLFDSVARLFEDLNEVGYSRQDLIVGHTYFLAKDPESLALKFAYDIVPLLQEYQREGLLKDLTLELEGLLIDLANNSQATLAGQIGAWLVKGGISE